VIFIPGKIKGVFIIEPEKHVDGRGFFARMWCQDEFESKGLKPKLVQCNISFNSNKGTLRGMHYQTKPYEEAKLIRCTRGAIYDVVLDLRVQSPTFGQWMAVELTAENHRIVYVPEGCVHGFQTLEDNTEAFYQMSEFHHPASARGIRWNDPAFAIVWPGAEPILSDKDRSYPDFIL